MPHISSHKLPKKDLLKLYDQFTISLEKSTKKMTTRAFLSEFLTKTEKVMLAKRLAVIFLLEKGVPQSYISESLKMSPSTISRMSLKHEIGKYKNLVKLIKELDQNFWDVLEKILRAGLPPITGRGRWKFLYEK